MERQKIEENLHSGSNLAAKLTARKMRNDALKQSGKFRFNYFYYFFETQFKENKTFFGTLLCLF